jgi:membrane fusion protein, multidrug efflux system
MVAPGQSLFTLVNDEEWFAVGNFRETDLHAIAVGDCATVYSMIDRTAAIKGVVQGLGAGVLDTDRINVPRSVPYVERSLNWVIVAQRFPVHRFHCGTPASSPFSYPTRSPLSGMATSARMTQTRLATAGGGGALD